MTAHGAPEQPGASSPPEQTALLKDTYDEVLDATKHQDDKINRLLTAVAFLTAAALALANLDSAIPVRARFEVGGTPLPLALITLGAFLVGVVATVIMLIASLTTPLRFPGGKRREAPEIPYVPPVGTGGQIYFHEIATSSVAEWYRKWQAPLADLARERHESLLRETHNLAVRTEHKYARTTEAVAVLSFSLLSFALSAVLVLIAAAQRPATSGSAAATLELPMDWRTRALLAGVLLGYSFLQLVASVRAEAQTVSELSPPGSVKRGLRRILGSPLLRHVGYPPSAALVPAAFTLFPIGHARSTAVLLGVGAIAAWCIMVLALPWPDEAAERSQRDWHAAEAGVPLSEMPTDDDLADQQRDKRRHLGKYAAMTFVIPTAYALAAGLAWCYRDYGWQLLAGYAAGGVLLITALARVLNNHHKRLERYRSRRGLVSPTSTTPHGDTALAAPSPDAGEAT